MTARRYNHHRRPRCIALAIIAAALLAAAIPAAAQDAPVRLTIKPVGEDSSTFFTITANPGDRLELGVELGNGGAAPMDATTFAADSFTMPNGGFGIREIDKPRTGTTGWVTYPTETLSIGSGQKITRTFRLAIPPGTPPGDYLTSLVIQNSDPIQGQGPVAMNQIVRQAVAVSIDVPGPRTPALGISGVRHESSGGRSVITFDVSNTGNTHLKPDGEFVLRDSSGAEINRRAVAMDRFYAATLTTFSVAMDNLLSPGDYVASLTLTDPTTGATAAIQEAAIAVPVVEVPVVLNRDGSVARPAQTNAPVDAPRGPSLALLGGIAAACLLLGIGIAIGVMRLRAGRAGRAVMLPSSSVPFATVTVVAPPETVSRPGKVKPLISRSSTDQGHAPSAITQPTLGPDTQ